MQAVGATFGEVPFHRGRDHRQGLLWLLPWGARAGFRRGPGGMRFCTRVRPPLPKSSLASPRCRRPRRRSGSQILRRARRRLRPVRQSLRRAPQSLRRAGRFLRRRQADRAEPEPEPASEPRGRAARARRRESRERRTSRCRRSATSRASTRLAAAAARPAELASLAPDRRAPGVGEAATGATTPADDGNIFAKLFGGGRSSDAAVAYAATESRVATSPKDGALGAVDRASRLSLFGRSPRPTGYDQWTAVYDISARTLYMPDGTQLEAHSGYGDKLDDPRFVSEHARGATPPHLYELTPREICSTASRRCASPRSATATSSDGRACSRTPSCSARTAIPTDACRSGNTTPSARLSAGSGEAPRRRGEAGLIEAGRERFGSRRPSPSSLAASGDPVAGACAAPASRVLRPASAAAFRARGTRRRGVKVCRPASWAELK